MAVRRLGSRALGRRGEDYAAAFLTRRGYRILEKNYRFRHEEVDLIVRRKDTVCFVEVKSRCGEAFGPPEEAVGPGKQRAIIRVALVYLQERGLTDVTVRFDVVAVLFDAGGELRRVSWIPGAFEART